MKISKGYQLGKWRVMGLEKVVNYNRYLKVLCFNCAGIFVCTERAIEWRLIRNRIPENCKGCR